MDGSIAMDERIKSLYIFNPNLGQKEGTEFEKILYYYPPGEEEHVQSRNIGLACALIGFTSQFSPDAPCELMQTRNAVHVFHHCEGGLHGGCDDVWMVATVLKVAPSEAAAAAEKAGKKGKQAAAAAPEGSEVHMDADVPGVRETLRLAWDTCRFFAQPTEQLLRGALGEGLTEWPSPRKPGWSPAPNEAWQLLRDRLGVFVPRYFSAMNLRRPDVLAPLQGMHFLPVDKQSYLRIQLMVNALEMRCPGIAATVFMYNGNIIYSGMDQAATRVLYTFLVDHVAGGAAGGEGAAAAAGGAAVANASADDPFSILGVGCEAVLRTVHVGEGGEAHKLLAVQEEPATLVFLLHADAELPDDFRRTLQTMLAPELQLLSATVGSKAHRNATDQEFRFVYFNRMNLAVKVSAGATARLSKEFMRHLCSMHREFNSASEVREICVKTHADHWIIGRRAGEREFFVLLDQKQFSLADANAEVERLSSAFFSNIFMGA